MTEAFRTDPAAPLTESEPVTRSGAVAAETRRAAPSPPEPAGEQVPGLLPAVDQPLRILFTSYRSAPRTGGQGIYLHYVTKALADRGHRVDVLSGPPYPKLDKRVRLLRLPSLDLYARDRTRLGVPAMPAQAWRRWTDFYEYWAHISGAFPEPHTFGRRMVQFLRTRMHHYDLIHDNQTLTTGLLEIGRLGLPVVGMIHHPITRDREIALQSAKGFGHKLLIRRWYSFLNRQTKVARRLDPIVTISEASKHDAAAAFRLEAERLHVVPLAVDTALFRPLPMVARAANRLITVASADVPLKGLPTLLRAFHALLGQRPDLELDVIGTLRPGPTKDMLDRLGIADRVRFRSGLSDEELVRAYNEATLAVVPSVYEGFGLPACEAMACGTPVVATDGGALPEVVADAGEIVPARNPDAMAATIGALLDDPGRKAARAAAGRRRVTEDLTWAKTATALEDIYRATLARGRPA